MKATTKRPSIEGPKEPRFLTDARMAFYGREFDGQRSRSAVELAALSSAYNAADMLAQSLKHALALRDKMNRVIEQIEGTPNAVEYIGLNSLGEVQGLGADVDRCIALYCERADVARGMRQIVSKEAK